MGLRDLFRRDNAEPSVDAGHDHLHDFSHDDGCGPVGPPVPAEAPATRVAPASVALPADGVIFRSFPLKLAVLQPLMYEPGAVLPAFSMPASIHPGAPVEDWFRGFTLTADQIAGVQALSLSRSNEVYRQVDPRWSADDDRFDITQLTDRDLDALPGLRTIVDPESMIGPDARAALSARGISIA